jgi:tRNA threonylcarbamoyladenosine biosynthesis protein TsaE
MKYYLASTEETEQFGATLWSLLPVKGVIFLQGELGAGKTTLVRGLLRAAGYTGAVKSPTFTLVEEYDLLNRKIFHFDLYRLTDSEELEWIGIRDYFEQNALCFIEWAEKGKGFLPAPDGIVRLDVKDDGRELTLELRNMPQKVA